MESKIRSLIKLDTQPVAVLKPENAPVRQNPGCAISSLAAISKGETFSFTVDTVGCPGSRCGLGFSRLDPDLMSGFLSNVPGPRKPEFYKETPARAVEYIDNLPDAKPSRHVVLKPLNKLEAGENPVSVVFLVNADQLSALVTLANYDRQDSVRIRFGSGCSQSILFAMCESEEEGDTCYVGITDPSGRLYLDKDLLSFSIPYHRFLEMESKAEGSFLTKETWNALAKRITK